jgi:hypothetical protein
MRAMSSRWRRWASWAGWLVTCAPVFVVLSSARWKLTHDPWYVREFDRLAWPVSALEMLATLQLTGIMLLVIPWTSVLGAIILTGYLGGAIASYVRIGEYYPPLVPFTTAVLAWLSVFLREPRLWVLLPIRRKGTLS